MQDISRGDIYYEVFDDIGYVIYDEREIYGPITASRLLWSVRSGACTVQMADGAISLGLSISPNSLDPETVTPCPDCQSSAIAWYRVDIAVLASGPGLAHVKESVWEGRAARLLCADLVFEATELALAAIALEIGVEAELCSVKITSRGCGRERLRKRLERRAIKLADKSTSTRIPLAPWEETDSDPRYRGLRGIAYGMKCASAMQDWLPSPSARVGPTLFGNLVGIPRLLLDPQGVEGDWPLSWTLRSHSRDLESFVAATDSLEFMHTDKAQQLRQSIRVLFAVSGFRSSLDDPFDGRTFVEESADLASRAADVKAVLDLKCLVAASDLGEPFVDLVAEAEELLDPRGIAELWRSMHAGQQWFIEEMSPLSPFAVTSSVHGGTK